MYKKTVPGMRSHRLVAKEKTGFRQNGKVVWKCLCDCGNEAMVLGTLISNQRVKSCGCLKKEWCIEYSTKHGLHGHDLYVLWKNMRKRCSNPNDASYKRYGGRGIKVCKRWDSFKNFLLDMGDRPSNKHSIERIDNNKGYSKANCKWATQKEQMRNTSRNHILNFQNKSLVFADMAKEHGLTSSALRHRLKAGWTLKKALTTPPSQTL